MSKGEEIIQSVLIDMDIYSSWEFDGPSDNILKKLKIGELLASSEVKLGFLGKTLNMLPAILESNKLASKRDASIDLSKIEFIDWKNQRFDFLIQKKIGPKQFLKIAIEFNGFQHYEGEINIVSQNIFNDATKISYCDATEIMMVEIDGRYSSPESIERFVRDLINTFQSINTLDEFKNLMKERRVA